MPTQRTVFATTDPIGGTLINAHGAGGEDAVFLPTKHNPTIAQRNTTDLRRTLYSFKKDSTRNELKQRCFKWFSVNRPLNMNGNDKKALYSILNLSPNTNTANRSKHRHIMTQSHSSLAQANVTSFTRKDTSIDSNIYEVNMTTTNTQYDIFMNNEYVNILQFILHTNVQCPMYLRNAFVCTSHPEQIKVSKAAKQIMYEDANAGGCSELSEGFSFEILRNCFNAKLVKTEMAIKYWWNSWKKTDYSIQINGVIIGVSVTRAMKFQGIFTKEDAVKLLTKKLHGINESSLGVLESDEWQRQILHIWATDEYIETLLHETFLELLFTNGELVANTIIIVTVASEDMWWVFYQDKYFSHMKLKKKKIKKKVIRKNMILSAVT